jgi:hypothetical protein
MEPFEPIMNLVAAELASGAHCRPVPFEPVASAHGAP